MSIARIAVVRVNRADRLAVAVLDDPLKGIVLELTPGLRFCPGLHRCPRHWRPDEIVVARALAVEIPANKGLRIRRLDGAQADLDALPEVHGFRPPAQSTWNYTLAARRTQLTRLNTKNLCGHAQRSSAGKYSTTGSSHNCTRVACPA